MRSKLGLKSNPRISDEGDDMMNVQYAPTSVQIPRSQRLTRDIDRYLSNPQRDFQMKFSKSMHEKYPGDVERRLTNLLEGLIERAELGETIRVEYTIEGRDEPYYQVISRNTVAKLRDCLKNMKVAEEIDSGVFFEAKFSAIRSLIVRRGPMIPFEEDADLSKLSKVRSGHWTD